VFPRRYVCHAEMNAIMNKNGESLRGCTIYVALFPCNECSKLIIQAGIVEVRTACGGGARERERERERGRVN
jgi:deoxycytidylate deaminase